MEQKNIWPMTLERRHRVGMRIIKTVVAVFLCGVLAFLRNTSALYSMFAALFCVQNSAGKTVHSSIDRVLGTLIGGVVGVVTVHTMNALNILHIDLLRYLLMSLLLIPVIELCLAIKKPGCAGMACMVIMCLVVDPGDKPAIDSIERVFETAVGVALACGIDVLLPYEPVPQAGTERAPRREDKPAPGDAQPPEQAADTPGVDAPEVGASDDEGEDGP